MTAIMNRILLLKVWLYACNSNLHNKSCSPNMLCKLNYSSMKWVDEASVSRSSKCERKKFTTTMVLLTNRHLTDLKATGNRLVDFAVDVCVSNALELKVGIAFLQIQSGERHISICTWWVQYSSTTLSYWIGG